MMEFICAGRKDCARNRQFIDADTAPNEVVELVEKILNPPTLRPPTLRDIQL